MQRFVRAFLSPAELAEIPDAPVRGSTPRAALALTAVIDNRAKTLSVIFLDGSYERVPLGNFKPSGTTKPDFSKLAIIDHGHTIAFGEYESATDAIGFP